MDVVNDMDMDDDIGKNSRKLNPCNWLQNTKTLKMKNFLKIFKIGRKDDMNKLDLIKFFERTLSLLKIKTMAEQIFSMRLMAFLFFLHYGDGYMILISIY